MPTLRSPFAGFFVNTCPNVMNRPASSGQHCRTGSSLRSTSRPSLTTCWQAPVRTMRGGQLGELRELRHQLQFFDPAFGNLRLDQPGDPVGDFFERLHAQRPAHAFVAAQQVDDDRHRAALDVLEEEGRPAVAAICSPGR